MMKDSLKTCNICNKNFKRQNLLNRHVRIHTGERPFKCDYCNSAFNQKEALVIHMKRHNGVKQYICQYCSAEFTQKGNLNIHVKRFHSDNNNKDLRMLQCPQCPCLFVTVGSLNAHICRRHAFEVKKCDVNKQAFVGELDRVVHEFESCNYEIARDLVTKIINDANISSELVQSTIETYNQREKLNLFINLHSLIDIKKEFENQNLINNSIDEHFEMNSDGSVGVIQQQIMDATTGEYKEYFIKRINNQRFYICCFCEKEFRKPSDLIRHTRTHTSEKPYQCGSCMQSFAVKSTLISHMRTHTSIKPIKCDLCFKQFSCNVAYRMHVKRKHALFDTSQRTLNESISQTQAVLPITTTTTENVINTDSVSSIIDGFNVYLNSTQNYAMSSSQVESVYKRVRSIRKPKQPHACEYCEKTFQKSNDLLRHKRVHTGERPFQCHVCDNSFTVKCALVAHLRKHLQLPKQYTCTQCFASFSTKNSLTLHRRVHASKRQFDCELCGFKFRTLTLYKSHMYLSHSMIYRSKLKNKNNSDQSLTVVDPAPDFIDFDDFDINVENLLPVFDTPSGLNTSTLQPQSPQPLCDAISFPIDIDDENISLPSLAAFENELQELNISYNNNSNNSHLKSTKRQEAKKYQCTFCDKLFLKPSQLKRHTYIHTGERPFKCPKDNCEKAFNQKNALTAHLRTHDGLKPYVCNYCPMSFTQNGNLQVHIKRMHKDITDDSWIF